MGRSQQLVGAAPTTRTSCRRRPLRPTHPRRPCLRPTTFHSRFSLCEDDDRCETITASTVWKRRASEAPEGVLEDHLHAAKTQAATNVCLHICPLKPGWARGHLSTAAAPCSCSSHTRPRAELPPPRSATVLGPRIPTEGVEEVLSSVPCGVPLSELKLISQSNETYHMWPSVSIFCHFLAFLKIFEWKALNFRLIFICHRLGRLVHADFCRCVRSLLPIFFREKCQRPCMKGSEEEEGRQRWNAFPATRFP